MIYPNVLGDLHRADRDRDRWREGGRLDQDPRGIGVSGTGIGYNNRGEQAIGFDRCGRRACSTTPHNPDSWIVGESARWIYDFDVKYHSIGKRRSSPGRTGKTGRRIALILKKLLDLTVRQTAVVNTDIV